MRVVCDVHFAVWCYVVNVVYVVCMCIYQYMSVCLYVCLNRDMCLVCVCNDICMQCMYE